MRNSNFTEKESLELISNMIQQTKQQFQVGSGNMFLYYGYTAVVISIAVYFLCQFTHQWYWHNLWLLMFVPAIAEKVTQKKRRPAVVTYIDKAVSKVWMVINTLCIITLLTIVGIGLFTKAIPLILMLPLALLYAGIGTACTGVITNEKSMTYFPIVSFIIGIYMLVTLSIGGVPSLLWNLLGGLAFLTMLVIPGYILNRKSLKQCSKN